MNLFSSPDSSLFFSRKDPQDPRLGELVKRAPDGPGVAILGYPDDEGIRLNEGRPGAKDGPDAIRQWLYRMTPHARQKLKGCFDLGNLKFESGIEHRHRDVAAAVEDLLGKNHGVLALGGGNDYAYADGLGFLKSLKKGERGVILNIDAHLDVRDLSRGLTSGTPFYRLLESEHKFDFFEIGIQGQCNSKAHWDYVEKKGGKIISMDEILGAGVSLTETVSEQLGDLLLKRRPAFLAIDMDSFAYPFAEGTSASWPLGILPHDFHPLLSLLLRRWDVRVLGLYEVSPALEKGSATSKLAAQWAHMYLHEQNNV
jgi:formiminoglutamase